MLPVEFIQQKRDRQSHTSQDIHSFILDYTRGQVTDEQMAAWLMAAFLNGLNATETSALTQVMLNSGERFSLQHLQMPRADKHSTGGVGDKTSLIIAALLSAQNVLVPMISGRGLGFTGGTLDKLASIPGFSSDVNLPAALNLLMQNRCVLMGQTDKICPADRKIYALRDTTATVDNISLITASIMSKKLAEDLSCLVFDVKFGSGAFMQSQQQAVQLAQSLLEVAKRNNVKATALLTSMQQPLGECAGNAVEVEECLQILRGQRSPLLDETRILSIELSAHVLLMAGVSKNIEQARTVCETMISDGTALKQFTKIISAHGGDLKNLPKWTEKKTITADQTGFIYTFDTKNIGFALIEIKAGRRTKNDLIEPSAGIFFHKKIGNEIHAGEPLFTLVGKDSKLFAAAEKRLRESVQITAQKTNPDQLIVQTLSN